MNGSHPVGRLLRDGASQAVLVFIRPPRLSFFPTYCGVNLES